MSENWGSDIDTTINLRIYKVSKGVAFCLYYRFKFFIFGKDHGLKYSALDLSMFAIGHLVPS